ncbi:MAG TPA: immunoglobulin domain-containing protein, partial [Verrucomicrobiota bacterium]|nr:immunoglobulin domain-containing protein [Verrucomicrobiota bacterium]
ALGLLLATNLPAQQPYTMTDILITFSEPVSADSATLTGNYQVYTMNNPGNQLTIYSAQLVSPSNVLLRTSPRVYLQNYTLKVNNVTDCSPSKHNPIAPNTLFNIWHELSLFTFSDEMENSWKYDASAVDYGPYWYQNSADFFSSWMDGWQLFIAKGGGGEIPSLLPEVWRTWLDITYGDAYVYTFYYWRTFDFPAGVDPKTAELHLRHIVDDGAVFYMNKHEVWAIGMPTSRPVYYTNFATRTVGDIPSWEPQTNANAVIQPYYIIPNDYLQQGVNEFAVEVHQANASSSDMYFGAVLTAVVPPIGVAVKPWFTIGPTPTNTTTATATSYTLTVNVSGTEPIYYTWYFVQTNSEVWTLIPGQTTSTLTINNLTPDNSGTYYVVVSNNAGAVTSSPAFLTVLPAPIITNQPVSVSTNTGVTVVFTVGATGLTPLSYQWYWNNTPISGATSSTLTLNNVLAYQAGSYYVVVTNVGGVVTSQVATLTLPPDTVKPYITMALGLLRATNTPPTQPPSLTDILITFSEPVDPTTATNPANYRVDRYGGGGSLQVSRVVAVD